MLRRHRSGLLFGPREAGCWEFLIGQAGLFCLVASAIGWFTGSPLAWGVARTFFFEGVGILLLIFSVAQICWVEERFPWIPGPVYQLVGSLLPASLLGLLASAVFSAPVLATVAFGCQALLLVLFVLSVVLRMLLAIWERLRGNP